MILHDKITLSDTDLIPLLGVIINSFIAFLALFQIRIIRREINIVEKQAVFERFQIYPIVNIVSFDTDINYIVLKLKNNGNGIATKLALRTIVFPLEVKNNDLELMDDDSLNFIEEETRKNIKIKPITSKGNEIH